MKIGIGISHGQYKSRTYKSWDSMVRRCTCKTDPSYDRYGGAGVHICERWLQFDEFYADMGDRPLGMTIDRIKTDGRYELSNCRWATPKQQANNRRNNRRVEYQGKQYTIRELSDLTGKPYSKLRERVLKLGWSVSRAIQA